MNWWQRFQQMQERRTGRKQDKIEESGFEQQWFLLAGVDRHIDQYPDPAQLNPIYPPNSTFWADPFLWSQNGRHYIFFEEYPFSTRRGRISAIEIDDQGRAIGEAKVVIEEEYHLSYPYLFEYEGQLYMMPEKCAMNRVDIYRCDEFPYRWTVVNTLIADLKIVDSTLLQHDGRWWLLAAAKKGRVRINESLFVFSADSPLSHQWTPHPANPVVRDLCVGRPAGGIYRNTLGELFRPAQNCLRRYGYGVSLRKITQLTLDRYQEETVWQKTAPEVVPEWRAMHHLDRRHGLMVMDAQRLLPKSALE